METLAANFYSSVTTRNPVVSPHIFNKFPKLDSVPKKLEMDYSRILNKPYFIQNFTWSTTDIDDAVIAYIDVPGDILLNDLVRVPFSASVYYRAKVTAILQTSGTPFHQGCLCIASVPYIEAGAEHVGNYRVLDRNNYMNAPHAFLHANEATPVMLEVPFYVQGKLAAIDIASTTVSPFTVSDDYATIKARVWNSLLASTNASTTLTVSVHIMFTELEFYVPHVDVNWQQLPSFRAQSLASVTTSFLDGLTSVGKKYTSDILDSARGAIRKWTGLHNPEHPGLCGREAVQFRQNLNLVDTPSFIEKMDPYGSFVRVVDDYLFETDVDEMALSYLLKKPQYIGTFAISATNNTAERLLWSRPITPIQEYYPVVYADNLAVNTNSSAHSNIIQTLAFMSKYWKGGMKLHIQAVMTSTTFVKLTIARDYSPDLNMTGAYPSFNDVGNLLTDTIEFSGGGQVKTIDLPFCSPLNQLPCSMDFEINALQHGMYYIYLHQPFVFGAAAALPIRFNVYLSCDDDFDFFGYATNAMLHSPTFGRNPFFLAEGDHTLTPILEEEKEASEEPLIVFEAQAQVMVNTSDGSPILNTKDETNVDTLYDMRPIKSIRDYARRFQLVERFTKTGDDIETSKGLEVFSLASLLGLTPELSASLIQANLAYDLSNLNLLTKMFHGYSGGVKFKVVVNGVPTARVWYLPPSFAVDNAGLEWTSTVPFSATGTALYNNVASQFQGGDDYTVDRLKYINPTVSVEKPNYIYGGGTPSYQYLKQGVPAEIILNEGVEFEFEVPYMSPYRFVGSSVKNLYSNLLNLYHAPTHNLGHLLVDVSQVQNFVYNEEGDKVVLTKGAVTIEIYAAITDEGRYGMAVNAPVVIKPALMLNGVGYITNPIYNLSKLAYPIARPTSSPACYYTLS